MPSVFANSPSSWTTWACPPAMRTFRRTLTGSPHFSVPLRTSGTWMAPLPPTPCVPCTLFLKFIAQASLPPRNSTTSSSKPSPQHRPTSPSTPPAPAFGACPTPRTSTHRVNRSDAKSPGGGTIPATTTPTAASIRWTCTPTSATCPPFGTTPPFLPNSPTAWAS